MKAGERFAGRYLVVSVLGRGGMGTVYEVTDLHLQRPRALKVLHGHVAEHAHLRERFALEARLGGRVDSPHLVDVVDAGLDADSGQLFMVMERLSGETLAQRLARLGPRPAAEVVEHLAQLALALDRMHASGVVHRDLKPANLFLHGGGAELARIKVLDLGIAKLVSGTQGETTSVAGTPAYMAPEQLRGRGVGPATDLHAVGLIAFTLLAGRAYWTEASELDPIAFALLAVRGPQLAASARARAVGVELPEAFDPWFARATAVRPERRFGSASEAVGGLAAALGVDPPTWLPVARPTAPLASMTDDDAEFGVERPLTGAATEDATAGAPEAAAGLPSTIDGAAGSRRMYRVPRVRARWLVGAAAIAAAGAVGALVLISRRSPPLVPWTPLKREGTVVACPILEVDDPARDGWLGAAAASLACERARVVLGGRPERTRQPAHLLGLPTVPSDTFPDEPFAGAPARQKSLEAARGSDAYFDGRVSATAAGFRVDLSLTTGAGVELARHRGEGVALIDAVKDAMAPMIGGYALPWAEVPDPVVADYAGAADLPTQLDLLDLTLAFAINAGQLGRDCDAFRRRHPEGTLRLAFARYECAYTLGTKEPEVDIPTSGQTDGERALVARVRHMVAREDIPAERALIEETFEATEDPWARAILASTTSCLLQNDKERARQWAQRAVATEPRNPIGEWCAPWEQLVSTTSGTESAPRSAVAMQAWRPWHPYGWLVASGFAKPGPDPGLTGRAYLLAPFNTVVATKHAEALKVARRLGDMRDVVDRLQAMPLPIYQLAAQRIVIALDVAAARLNDALTRASAAMMPSPGDAGWVWEQRLELSVEAIRLAVILGREHVVADRAVGSVVLDPRGATKLVVAESPFRIATVCGYASPDVAASCFEALDRYAPPSDSSTRSTLLAFSEGARKFAGGELVAAAEVWRAVARAPSPCAGLMDEAMVRAFSAAHNHTFVELLVESALAAERPADMVLVEGARAARRRVDRPRARELAKRVEEAWRLSPDAIPAMREMEEMIR